MAFYFVKFFSFRLTIMIKTLLTAFVISGTLSFAAQAQTTPASTATPGNHTAGTTANPVDPTSKTGQTVSGVTGQGASGNTTPDRPTTTGNHTAGTTNNPVDPTSNLAGATRSDNTSTRKTHKTKTRASN
jgi:hypothetical protein